MSEAANASQPRESSCETATLRQVTRLAGLGVWCMDCTDSQQTLVWDNLCHQLHDTDPERFQPTLGSSLLLYEDESRRQLEEALMACSAPVSNFQVEVDRLLNSGQTRCLLVAGQLSSTGQEIFGYYQDVSQQKQLLLHLQQEQRQTRALFRTLPDLLFAIDAAGFIRQYYTGQSPLLNSTPENCVGRHLGEVFPYLRQEFPAKLRQACESGELTALEFKLHANDQEATFEARILPLEKDPTQNHKALILIRDISAQHRRAQELKRSQEAALQASRIKSQFLANMSHEIRTPLNGMIGMTELLLETDLQNEQRDYALTALRSAQSLLETVNDILDLSKIEANRLDLENIPFSLRTVVEETLDSLAIKAHEKGLELLGSVAPSVPSRVVGDPTRIRQILNNLLSNAIKFTEHGEVELQLVQREPGIIRVTVFDTGTGIAYDRQREIFDPFTQADGSTTRNFGGTGLGLTICRQLVEKMGGRIWLESQPGQGSRFSFTVKLPNYHTASQQPDSPYLVFIRDLDQPDLTEEHFVNFIQGKRVLIIDDNASCRRILKETLANWGVEAQVVAGPGPAMQTLREAQRRGKAFNLVILDFQMPGCDGLELAQELPSTLTSILMVTLGQPRKEQLNPTGIKKVVIKPLLSQELARILLSLLRQQPGNSHTPTLTQESNTGPLKILIAEDNLVNAKVVSKMLQRLGHEVIHVINGALAVDYLEHNQIDVVLMDVQMPVMDGFEATRRWRNLEKSRTGRIPIVALTGNAMLTDRELCLEAGMDLHLTKPIRLDLLDQTLSSLPLNK